MSSSEFGKKVLSSKISYELLKENLAKKDQKTLLKEKFEKLGPVTRGLFH